MSLTFSRRSLLKLSASTLLAHSLWPGALRAADSPSTSFRFAVVNDLHLTDENCVPFFQRLVATFNAVEPKLDFLLVAGDLTEDGTAAQCKTIHEVLAKLAMPYYCVPGNHDWRAVTDGKGTTVDRVAYEETFAKSLSYVFEHQGWQFLGLDSTDSKKGSDFGSTQATRDFLDLTVPKLDRRKPLVLFTHHPLGPQVPTRLTDADALLARFKDHNLAHVFCGHYHGFTERHVNSTLVTTNRACSFRRGNHDGTPEKGYFVCTAAEGAIQRKFVEFRLAAASQPASSPTTHP